MTPQYIKINEDGSKTYWKNKEMTILHREDGPAIEWVDGYKVWYLNGQPHREDGPAIEHGNGAKNWYKHGQRHREDGPAYEGVDGTKFWIINGEHLSEQEFLKQTAKEIILTMDEIAAKFGIEVSKLKIAK
jgi:hypothetical protein